VLFGLSFLYIQGLEFSVGCGDRRGAEIQSVCASFEASAHSSLSVYWIGGIFWYCPRVSLVVHIASKTVG
jgi:hypothetical protein